MKNFEKILIFVSVIVIGWLLLEKCNDTPQPQLIDNSALLESLKPLEAELSVLRAKNDSLVVSYQNNKNVKDSIVYDVRKRFITIYDTLRNDSTKYYSESQVDTIIDVYEGLLADCDTLIAVKDSINLNLTIQNEKKDTAIINYKSNEIVLKKDIKQEKKKKWNWGLGGLILGYLLGKAT